jgi:hypothetical protein
MSAASRRAASISRASLLRVEKNPPTIQEPKRTDTFIPLFTLRAELDIELPLCTQGRAHGAPNDWGNMKTEHSSRLLLTTAFKPYGVITSYTREPSGLQMEFFNNQITREQGVHSPRENYRTFSLFMLADNLSMPTVILDFPSQKEFMKELRHGYSHVGISFIVPNIYKVQWMARYIRKYYPETKIILGGHGTSIPDIEKIVPCDAVCRGEGIRWLQTYFGEDASSPIRHPVMTSPTRTRLYGVNVGPFRRALMLFPGVGCPFGCEFCATTHKFDKKYIAYLPTGKDVFDLCLKGEQQIGIQTFGIMDENFFVFSERAKDLLRQMEAHRKPYVFELAFASGNVALKMGVDFFVRLGVKLLYIGVESKTTTLPKAQGVDFHALVRDLQKGGISVITSSILFLDHHDQCSLWSDIDWAIGLESDFHQFMQLHAWPGTALWKRFSEEERIRKDLTWDRITGQGELANLHVHFKPEEARTIIRDAFRKKYHAHGPGMLNAVHTALRGYVKARKDFEDRKNERRAWNAETSSYEKSENPTHDHFMELRLEEMRRRALRFRPLLWAAKLYAPNDASREKANAVMRFYHDVFGPPTVTDMHFSFLFVTAAAVEALKIWIRGVLRLGELVHQPPTIRAQFPTDGLSS